ncbi:prenyltransferase/squalene oxidase repeat-containing protein [Streptomyces sp. NPDC059070]|uniref:prenyltransferase/squalene oxidase repeat-containing protein n=1 Tax=unclassified Streptomyces TaxID=2593676 RepID=UPI0034E1D8CC
MGTAQQPEQRTGRRRLLSLVSAAVLTVAAGVTFVSGTSPASADPLEKCTATTGAIVAVDFGPFGGKVERGCDTTPTTGYELLRTGGFTTTGTVHDGDAFVCRIGKGSGTQYPTPDKEDCVLTPQATAYWSYWIASLGQKSWTYSPLGAMARTPKPGDVDAWVFGGTDVGGTSGRPAFSPDDVRSADAITPDPTVPTEPPKVPAGKVDVPAATRWITSQLKDGKRVVDGSDTNYFLTTEAVFALAGADPKSPAAKKAADFLAEPEQTDAYAYPAGKNAVPDATAASRLALVAEATGKDPRAFGGHDLLGDLLKYLCPRDIGDGDTVDGCLTKGDFRTTGQSDAQAMAVIALSNGGATLPAIAVNRLTGLQCENGGFTSVLIRSGGWCDSDANSTGLITLALQHAGGHNTAVQKARAYLKKTQLATGAWPSSATSTTGSPASTAWAAQALRALGDTAFADAGTSWLSRHQFPEGGFGFEEDDTASRLFATSPATVAAVKSDLVALTTKASDPPTTPRPGDGPDLKKGVAYLTDTSRLIQGRYYESGPGTRFADYGLTVDGAFALAATGGDNTVLRNIVDFLDKGGKDGKGRTVNDYMLIGTKYAGGGSIGKTALLAEAVGRNPRDFAGKNLISALAAGRCGAKDTTSTPYCAGKGAYQNAKSVFDQSLGVIAQLRAGDATAASGPAAYLKSVQQSSGAWPSLIGKASDIEVDSTAMAAMAVALLPDADSRQAVDKALAWLATQQKPDGGFPGASGNSVNSAALAVQGLSLDAVKYRTQIAKARTFLASQQNGDGGFRIAKEGQPGSDVRASTQAVGGATGISFGLLTRDLKGTSPQPLPTTGATPGTSTGSTGAPAIVTPGDAAGGTGSTGGTSSGTGPLASTGTQAGALACAAVLLTLGGWSVTRAARRRRPNPGSDA